MEVIVSKKNKVFIKWVDQKIAILNSEKLRYDKQIAEAKEELERINNKIKEVEEDIIDLTETRGELDE
jgi:archaellum component FlaC